MKMLVERPGHEVAFVVIFESEIFLIVDKEINFIGSPLNGINMKGIVKSFNIHAVTKLSIFQVVVSAGVHGAMHHRRVITHMFHDVDLSAFRPVAVITAGWHHPDGRPGSPALWKARPGFNAAIQKILFVFGDQAGRCPFPICLYCPDGEMAVFYKGIFDGGGIILKFIVAPAVITGLIAPVPGGRSAFIIKLFGPYKRLIALRKRRRCNQHQQDREMGENFHFHPKWFI